MPTAWTDQRVERLITLWSEGLSAAEIAERLGGVTRNAVLGKLHRLKRLGRRPRMSGPKPAARLRHRSAAARRPPQAAPRPAAKPDPAVGGLAPSLEKLRPHACHWPIGDPRAADFAFCGRPAGVGSYCCAHRRVAYRPRGGG